MTDDLQHRKAFFATLARKRMAAGALFFDAAGRIYLVKPTYRAGWLIPVHPRAFIPAANPEAVTLIDRLIADGHAFQHLPSEVPSSRRVNPDWLVRHVLDPHGRPVARAALETLDRGCGAEFIEARAALSRRMQDAGIPTWTWVPSGPRSTRVVPPLPPSDQRPGTTVHAELLQIQASRDADYRYGPSTKFTLKERKTA